VQRKWDFPNTLRKYLRSIGLFAFEAAVQDQHSGNGRVPHRKEHTMSRKMMIVAVAAAAFSLVATDGFAQRGGGGAQTGGGGHGGFGGPHGDRGFGGNGLSSNPVTPHFNDPGPQLAVPQPGNPAQQLSPLGSAGQPDSLGIK
jgi:hypothetical protein